jgi:hypothetical protein
VLYLQQYPGGVQWHTTFAGMICLLNSRYLVVVLYRLCHPMREKLRDLGTMNMSRCIQGYSNVLSMDITPSESFTRHKLLALLDRCAYGKRLTGFVTSVSKIMSVHSSVRSHLDRFRIVEDPMCVCLKDYETVNHLIWHCKRFGSERHRYS